MIEEKIEKETKKYEDKKRSFTSIFADLFSAGNEILKTLFGKQKDNKMLSDLGIKKGWKNGIIDTIFVFLIVPFKIVTFVLKPSWTWVNFVQRHIVSPMFEIEALTGSESPSRLLGEIYETYLYHIKGKDTSGVESSELKPHIKILERLMVFAKIRVVSTLLIFILVADFLYEYFELYFENLGMISSFFALIGSWFGYHASGFSNSDFLLGGLSSSVVIYYGFIIFSIGVLGYMIMFMFKFFVEAIRSVMYADQRMMKDFVDDTLHYTISKAIDIYGEKMALEAYEKLILNVVVSGDRYTKDEPHYKKLEHIQL